MKKIFILLLIPFASFGQGILPGVVSVSDRHVTDSKVYLDIPTAPTFSDPQTLVQATTGNGIQSGDTGGKTDFLVGSDYDFMGFNGLSGNYRMKSLDETDPSTWATLGSPSPNDYSFNASVSTPGVELYNLRLEDSDNLFKLPGADPVKAYKIQNSYLANGSFGGVLVNENVADQDYGDATLYFVMFSGMGGENVYAGRTGSSVVDYVGTTSVTQCYGINSGREGAQFNNHYVVIVDHVTLLNCGTDTGGGVGQNNVLQGQGIGFLTITNSIFTGRAPGMFATNKARIRNCYWESTQTDRPIYFQDISANGYHNENVTPDTILIEDVDFRCDGYTEDHFFRIQEENAVYVFRRLTLPASATDIYQVDGAAPVNIIVEDITFGTPNRPTFGPPPEAGYIGYQQVVTDDETYNLGRGFRTPNP
jgi:hypothetical protein